VGLALALSGRQNEATRSSGVRSISARGTQAGDLATAQLLLNYAGTLADLGRLDEARAMRRRRTEKPKRPRTGPAQNRRSSNARGCIAGRAI
jgi:hypothetical protein